MQSTALVLLVCIPTSHNRQAPGPRTDLYAPLSQAAHTRALAAGGGVRTTELPLSHTAHASTDTLAEGDETPAGHEMHELRFWSCGAEYDPDAHGEQPASLSDPVVAPYLPGPHAAHALTPSRRAYAPARHGVHATEPTTAECWPAEQLTHVLEPSRLAYAPATHGTHALPPGVNTNVPAVQLAHATAPTAED